MGCRVLLMLVGAVPLAVYYLEFISVYEWQCRPGRKDEQPGEKAE